jgi:hypothetical protein
MKIEFSKKKGGQYIISCIRKDGTLTWKQSTSFFVMHDLCHYAAETTLGFKNSFFGMLASGIDISEFDLPREQRGFPLPDEALFTEHLVNLLLIDCSQGRIENFINILFEHKELKNTSGLPKDLLVEQLETIRLKCSELNQQWNVITEGQTLELIFEE